MPARPTMMPPVGKSGPGTMRHIADSFWSAVASGCSMAQMTQSMTSPRLWGGMFVAMPTAMPDDPLTSRFGKGAGRTAGSSVVSS